MILVDKELRKLIENEPKLIKGLNSDSQINCVSCDLTVDKVVNADMKKGAYEILPGDVIFVRANEELNMPNDLLGIVTEKNSRMRQGLRVDAPRYHPGHKTKIYLRVQNISDKAITIAKNNSIAQIMFEKLSEVPDVPYDMQLDSSYNEETEYRGFGKYESEYSSKMHELGDALENAKEDIESASHRIYSNVLVLMGVIVAVFSMLTLNFNAFTQNAVSMKYLVAMNLTLAFCIVLLMGLIFIFVNSRKSKALIIIYLVILILLAIAVVGFSLFTFTT